MAVASFTGWLERDMASQRVSIPIVSERNTEPIEVRSNLFTKIDRRKIIP